MMNLCAPITKPDPIQIALAKKFADIVEFRFDYFPSLDFKEIKKLRDTIGLPVIFKLPGKEKLDLIQQLAALKPDYFDLEWDTPEKFIEDFAKEHPEIKLIFSKHDFEKTPIDLKLTKISNSLCKLAMTAVSTCDALRMLLFVKKNPGMIGLCMGEMGEITRILAPTVGSYLTFGSLNEEGMTAPFQTNAKDLLDIYNYRSLSPKTSIYGLIGDPVNKSIGHLTHNHAMRKMGLDSVYVKMKVVEEELGNFFALAKELGIKGLSVTMPLKKKVLPFLDEIDPKAQAIGAVNTIHFKEGKLIGYNTDGVGALDAIETKMKAGGKKIVILGAGGASQSIAFEAKDRGAEVAIFNRNFENFPNDYDILVNTTPVPMPIDASLILSKSIVMDINTFPKLSPFLQAAREKGCFLIYGYEMFLGQAAHQFAIWFQSDAYEIIKEKALQILGAE